MLPHARSIFSAVLPTLCLLACRVAIAAEPVSATSPDGKVRIEFSLRASADVRDVPHYRVWLGAQEVAAPSRLGIELADGSWLGGPCEFVGSETRAVNEEFTQVRGKRRHVTARAQEVVVRLRETTGARRAWEVVIRAYDDGAAFRYRFPAQEGWDSLAITKERTEFHFRADDEAYALPLDSFTTSHEARYLTVAVKALPPAKLIGLPILLHCPGDVWAAVTESDVNEFAGMYLSAGGDGVLSARLSPLPGEKGIAVRHVLPHASPWRVIMLADRVGKLVESDLVLKLGEPCAIADTSWIKTGKTTFPWWNGFYEVGGFKPGLNTETAKYYIDFCARAGIPFHSLDGIDNVAWYGGPIVPYEGADITKGIKGLDLPEVLRYAKQKGVGIRLWMHWKAAEKHMERAFPLYRQWGIHGVMLDFMDRDDQEMYRFLRRAVKLAADNHLTVTLHGCPQPTGLERTYPNLLTSEGVMNLEYDKWDPVGITPEHELTVVFTRMLAGPMDFHQGSFRTVSKEAFRPQNAAPLVIGTPARTLASYVVYQNHLSMVADYPSAYGIHLGSPLKALASIPTTWDETIVVDARVGEFIAVARRSGDDWHIGAMTAAGRTVKLPVSFLGAGRYSVEEWSDNADAPQSSERRDRVVSATGELELKLSDAGGAYVKLSPVK
jgi:alpha-glucosidase